LLVSHKRPPRYDLPKAAPGRLRLVQLFLNTENHETGLELLATPADAGAWLADHGLACGRIERADLARLRAFRGDLRAFVAGTDRAEALRRAVDRTRLTIDFDEPTLVSRATGVDRVVGTIVGVVYDAIRDGSWSRLKACRTCGWAFWDESRSRTATWCSMQLCGNRAKVRRYRARNRGRAGSA
jgi:hypothetical protein